MNETTTDQAIDRTTDRTIDATARTTDVLRVVSRGGRDAVTRGGPRAGRRPGLRRRRRLPRGDAGMSTAEYAVGTIAACGFAAVLYKIVTSGPVRTALTGVIEKALHAPF